MASVDPVISRPLEVTDDGQMLKVKWTLTTANPLGTAVSLPEWADKTWDVDGVSAGNAFGGATCAIQGGNTGTAQAVLNGATLNKANSGAATVTAAAGSVFALVENPLFLFPNLTVVGAGATIVVTLVCRRATPLRQ
jgi:hypothetical protein